MQKGHRVQPRALLRAIDIGQAGIGKGEIPDKAAIPFVCALKIGNRRHHHLGIVTPDKLRNLHLGPGQNHLGRGRRGGGVNSGCGGDWGCGLGPFHLAQGHDPYLECVKFSRGQLGAQWHAVQRD